MKAISHQKTASSSRLTEQNHWEAFQEPANQISGQNTTKSSVKEQQCLSVDSHWVFVQHTSMMQAICSTSLSPGKRG